MSAIKFGESLSKFMIPIALLEKKPFVAVNGSRYYHRTSYKYLPTLVNVQSARTITLGYICFELCPFELCKWQFQWQNRVRSISLKPLRTSSWKSREILTNILSYCQHVTHVTLNVSTAAVTAIDNRWTLSVATSTVIVNKWTLIVATAIVIVNTWTLSVANTTVIVNNLTLSVSIAIAIFNTLRVTLIVATATFTVSKLTLSVDRYCQQVNTKHWNCNRYCQS